MSHFHPLPFHHECLITNRGYFVELICSTEVRALFQRVLFLGVEFLNSAVYSVHFVLHIVCCPEWVLFLPSLLFSSLYLQSRAQVSFLLNAV